MFYDRLLESYMKEMAMLDKLRRVAPVEEIERNLPGIMAFTLYLKTATVFKFDRNQAQYFYDRGWLGRGFEYSETFRLPYSCTFIDFDGILDVILTGPGDTDFRPEDPSDLYELMHKDRLRGILLVDAEDVLPSSLGDLMIYTAWDDMNISLFYARQRDLRSFAYPRLNYCAHLCSLPQKTTEVIQDHPICRSATGKLPHKTCGHAKAMNRILALIANCIHYIHAINVETVYHPGRPAKKGKGKKKKRQRPLTPYYTLRLRLERHEGSPGGASAKTGRHVSHPYTVRGHFRRLRSGKVAWVRPHVRGLRASRRVVVPQKRYIVPRRTTQ